MLKEALPIVRKMRTIVRDMRTNGKRPIDWLFPPVRTKVLAVVLMNPDKRWYLRDLVRRTGLAQGSVQRELAGLRRAGILTSEKEGNRVYYQADISCSFYPELRGLIVKTAGMVDVLKEHLSSLNKQIKIAFVYGSVAQGRATAQSDVDLMVIGRASFGQVVDALQAAQQELSREVNPTVMDTTEFRERAKKGEHFISTVLKGEKLFVVGSPDELEKLAE